MRARLTLAAILALAAGTGAGEEARLAPALTAAVEITDLEGGAVDAPAPGMPVRIDVRFESAAGTEAPRGLDLFAWLRRSDGAGTSCGEAARAYLATERSLPVGAIDLSGSVLAVLTEDAAISLVDPHFQLATANILDAATLPERIDTIVPDPWLRRVIAVSTSTGTIRAMYAAGGPATRLADGLSDLSAVFPAPNGRLWVRADGRLGPLGGPSHPADGAAPSSSGRYVATWTASDAAIVDLADSRRIGVPADGVIAARAVEDVDGRLVALAALTEAGLTLRWSDAPDVASDVPLPEGFTRLDIDPAGRFAVLHDPNVNDVAIVDIARGHLAQVIVASPPVSEVGFTGRDLFLMASDHSLVATVPLGSIARGTPPRIAESTLGRPSRRRSTTPGLLVPLAFEDAMIAVHPGSYTAFRLHGTTTSGPAPPMLSGAARGTLPPMFSVTLRGGVPRQVVAIDRGFREIAPGRFRAVVALPDDHGYELVGTTGLGGMSFCATLSSGTRPVAPPEGRVTLVAEGSGWRLRFTDERGRPLPFDGDVLLVGLQGGWREHLAVSAGPDGLTEQVLHLPDTVPVAVVPRSRGPRPFRSITTERHR